MTLAEKYAVLLERVRGLSDLETPEATLEDRSNFSEERSHGNSTDVFYDGQLSASAATALSCREALKKIGDLP